MIDDTEEARYQALLEDSERIMQKAKEKAEEGGHKVVATVVLFSGGHDSTLVAHLFKDRASHFMTANTGIGVEETRQFVRGTVAAWGKPLIEEGPADGKTFRDQVLGMRQTPRKGSPRYKPELAKDFIGPRLEGVVPGPQPEQETSSGFPGPGAHGRTYNLLKGEPMIKARNQLVGNPRKERVIFITGIRQAESARRSGRDEVRRQPPGASPQAPESGSIVWASPILHWTKLDMNEYRRRNEKTLPVNEISDVLHMSGECLCGAFAQADELEFLESWTGSFPGIKAVVEQIHELQEEAVARKIPRCVWGWARHGDCENG